MKSWKIPVEYTVAGAIIIEANTLEEAIEIARDDDEVIPTSSVIGEDYVSGSWCVSTDDEDLIREAYNANQEDDNNKSCIETDDGVEHLLRNYED